MAEHLRNRLDGYTIGQRHCRGERVAGHVECQILVDAAEVGNLLQVGVHLLIRRYGEEQTALAPDRTLVLFNKPQRRIQQSHMYRNIRFLPFGVYPHVAVGPALKHVGGEILQVDVGQSGVATEEEQVADDLQTSGSENLALETTQLGIGQIAAVDLLEVNLVTSQRVALRPAVQMSDPQHGLQLPHQFHRRVVGQLIGDAQPAVEFRGKAGLNLLDRNVRNTVAVAQELLKTVARKQIAQVGLATTLSGAQQVGIILDEAVADAQKCRGALVESGNSVFEHRGRDGLLSAQHLVVAASYQHTQFIERIVDLFLLAALARRAVILRQPAVGVDVHPRGKVYHFVIDRDTCHDGSRTVLAGLALLENEDDGECALACGGRLFFGRAATLFGRSFFVVFSMTIP